MLDINRRSGAGKHGRKVQNFTATPEQLAHDCLAEARNDPDRAVAIAAMYAHGRRLRATHAAIGTAFLRGVEATDAR
jgi:hypothetical protein